ncbi:CapA family protein [Halorubrum sp. Ea8]|uniref:CapA family protein n=1 Tax=Halorubrum sp. Ea8 TaxID=1383841 RepID=UPI000B98AEA9|nr:CapA family protein [Halorubrum sp. Ea8]OYR47919.1 hypothetical protein DJ74_11875 [Halorubrum sp. Ea8]
MTAQEHAGARVRLADAEPSDGDRWSLFVGGDTIVESTFAAQPFGPSLRRRMRDADLTVLNLEAAIEGTGDPLTKSGAIKRTVERTPEVLADGGVDAVTLANNHAMDLGPDGLIETVLALRRAGIGVCGAGTDAADALAPHRERVGEDSVEVALFGVCEREFGVAETNDPGTAWINHPNARRRVAETADSVDVTLLFPHGGIEYVPFPPQERTRQLRRFVDDGVDAIVGHHPHVPQGWEVVDGTPLFYSLGNFLFEQQQRPNTREGLALELSFRGTTPVSVGLVPVVFDDGRVREITDEKRKAALVRRVHRLGRLTAEELPPHWQEVADLVFLQRYASWLREVGGGDPMKRLCNPGDHLRKGGLWDADDRESELLILLNLIRNESHRAVIETALELRTGIATDHRTADTIELTRELLEETEDRRIIDPPSKSRLRVESLVNRLAGDFPGFP